MNRGEDATHHRLRGRTFALAGVGATLLGVVLAVAFREQIVTLDASAKLAAPRDPPIGVLAACVEIQRVRALEALAADATGPRRDELRLQAADARARFRASGVSVSQCPR